MKKVRLFELWRRSVVKRTSWKVLDPKYLHIFTAEMDFLEFTAYPCLYQTPVNRFQGEIPECKSLNCIPLNLQDRLDDLRISSVFRVYRTKNFLLNRV